MTSTCEADALRSCFPQLVTRLQADDVVDNLYQANLLTQAVYDGLARDISQKSDLRGVNRRILIAVGKGPEGSVAKFAGILKSSQPDLAGVLVRALFVTDTTRVPRNRSVSASAVTASPTEEGVAVQGSHDDTTHPFTSSLPNQPPLNTSDTTALSRGESAGQDDRVASLEGQLQKAMSLIDEQSARIEEQSARIEELSLQIEELKAKIEPGVFQTTPLLREGLTLCSEKLPDLPIPTACATAVVIDRKVYICGGRCQDIESSQRVLVYDFDEKAWNTLPALAPQYKCQAVAINNQLVLIGGWVSEKITNVVSTWNGQRWEQVFPPMPIKRSRPGVLTHGTIVVVAGGRAEDKRTLLSSIDVLDTVTRQWWTPVNLCLPQPMYAMTITANSLHLHVAAASVNDDRSSYTKTPTKRVLRLPVNTLTKGVTIDGQSQHRWTEVEPTPNFDSALLQGTGHLVAVGGDDDSDKATTHVAMCIRNKWSPVGQLLEPRARCAIANVGATSILVCGGYSDTRDKTSLLNSVELLNACR